MYNCKYLFSYKLANLQLTFVIYDTILYLDVKNKCFKKERSSECRLRGHKNSRTLEMNFTILSRDLINFYLNAGQALISRVQKRFLANRISSRLIKEEIPVVQTRRIKNG